MRPYSLSFQRKCLNEFINSVIQKRIKAVTHSFPSFFLQSPINHLSSSLESRREMRQIETFFALKKTTNFIINKKHGFNKSVSCVRRRVGRVNIFIKPWGIGSTFLADKYELSARLLFYVRHTLESGRSLIFKRNEKAKQKNIVQRCKNSVRTK